MVHGFFPIRRRWDPAGKLPAAGVSWLFNCPGWPARQGAQVAAGAADALWRDFAAFLGVTFVTDSRRLHANEARRHFRPDAHRRYCCPSSEGAGV